MASDTRTIHPDLSAQLAQMQAMIAAQNAEIERLRSASNGKLTFKVSEKGAVMICGMQRFPITLYATQWERILDHADALRAFIAANAATIARK